MGWKKENDMNARTVKYFVAAVLGFTLATIVCCSRPVSAIGGEWALPMLAVGVLAFRDMMRREK